MLLAVENLTVRFDLPTGPFDAVDDISFNLDAGKTLALVGESGSGKSLTALAIAGLLPPAAHIANGRVLWNNSDVLQQPSAQRRQLRGRQIAMIFQQPMTSLNPVLTAGAQISEAVHLHQRTRGRAAREAVLAALARVGIADPQRCARSYPHELSGGMQQRVMIAMALACQSELLIADEPTTALDVTVQRHVLDLLRDLQRETGLALLFITHDFGVVAHIAHDVAVMQSGRIVEHAPAPQLFRTPQHPYTQKLLACTPRIGRTPAKTQQPEVAI